MAKVENFKVVLGPYKGLKVRKPDATVSEEELEAVCLREQKNFAQKVDVEGRDVKLGDIAVIDFTGYCDGEAFEGGAGTDYPLEIGSGTFIPGFEEQIVGASVGSSVDVNVTFPEDYGAPNLAGKPSLFKVTVKKIMEYHYPVLEDTVRADIKQKLLAQKAAKVEETYENALIDAIIGESEIEVTDEALKLELDNLLKEWKAVMHMNQINVDQYYSMTGMNDEKMKAQLRKQAELRLRSRLVLEAIAQTEGLEASEIEVEQQISKLAEQYNMDRAQAKEKLGSEHIDALKSDIRMHKALNLVKENAVNVAE